MVCHRTTAMLLAFALITAGCSTRPAPACPPVKPAGCDCERDCAHKAARPPARPPSRPAARPVPPPRAAKPKQPTRFELYAVLMRHHDMLLSKARHCDQVVGVPLKRKPTLGDWVAYNLSLLKDGKVTLPTWCRLLPVGPAGAAGVAGAAGAAGVVWECQVGFSVVNPRIRVFWNWGVRFRLRNADRRMVPKSLMCTGSG